MDNIVKELYAEYAHKRDPVILPVLLPYYILMIFLWKEGIHIRHRLEFYASIEEKETALQELIEKGEYDGKCTDDTRYSTILSRFITEILELGES